MNKRKDPPACICSMTVPGSAVICVSGRWCHFQGGMPRPVAHAPVPWLHPHVKTIGAFDLKQRCAEWSPYDIKVQREWFEAQTWLLLQFFTFVYKKSTFFVLNTFILICKTLFSFAILKFSCKYMWHCFDCFEKHNHVHTCCSHIIVAQFVLNTVFLDFSH